MKCPNCGDKVEEHVNSSGGGSRYCLSGCGHYQEFPNGTMEPPRPTRTPVSPKIRRRRSEK